MTTKEKGAVPFESAPTSETTRQHSSAPAPEALAWLAITGLMMLAGWLWEVAR